MKGLAGIMVDKIKSSALLHIIFPLSIQSIKEKILTFDSTK